MVGMHGTFAANTAVQNCDLLFAIGTRFDDRATGDIAKFAPHASVVHVDIDPASISRNVAVQVPVVGDARMVLEDLLPHVRRPDHGAVAAWAQSPPGHKASRTCLCRFAAVNGFWTSGVPAASVSCIVTAVSV